ncbi:MAG: trimeric intracellular cation channel family protein [Rickettsiales bacterium]
MEQFLSIADHMAVAVFAVTGALMASRKQMDIFGFIMLGTVTGVGGGSLRDLLLGAPVFWIAAPGYIATCVVAASATFFLAHLAQSRYRVILWLDAVGLALFAVLGAEKTLALGVSSIIALVMGVMSATFGGIIRDVLGGEVPLLLRREIYVTAALAGAAVFVGLSVLGLSPLVAGVAAFIGGFGVRALALKFGWSLPAYRSRPGRSQGELEAMGILPSDEER